MSGLGPGGRGEDEPLDPRLGGGPGGNEPTLPLPAIDLERSDGVSVRRVAVYVAIGAAALLAVVSALVGNDDDGDADALAAVCTEHVVPLTQAIEEWSGVTNWADRPGEQPDLAALATTALTELGQVTATSTLDGAADDLSRDLATAEAATARAAALYGALDRTAEVLDQADAPSPCELPRLEAALALD